MGDYNRLIISGDCPGGSDEWSVGLAYSSPTIGGNLDDIAELQEWTDLVAARITALPANSLITLLSSGGTITKVRGEYRLGDDTLEGVTETIMSKTGSGTPSKVLQAAIVISLRTNLVGRSYRGRCYWPAWNYTPAADLTIGSSLRGSILTDFKSLAGGITLDGSASGASGDWSLRVRSSTLNTETLVTSLLVGSVPDTQRRRRDDTLEVYSSVLY